MTGKEFFVCGEIGIEDVSVAVTGSEEKLCRGDEENLAIINFRLTVCKGDSDIHNAVRVSTEWEECFERKRVGKGLAVAFKRHLQ